MARKPYKYYFIYKTTNLVNGKFYIGMHSTNDLEDGYLGSGKRLKYSVNKYGKENFKKEILEFLPNRSSLINREIELVNEGILKDLLCMNLMNGGKGGWSPNIFGGKENNKKFGLRVGKIHRKKMKTDSIYFEKFKKIGIKNLKDARKSGKWKVKFGKESSFFNKRHTEETKQIMRDKAHLRIGDKNSMYGRCWITNGKENKVVKKENLVLEKNWCLGRII
jgi:hypothetical protein